jgi:acetyltransferase
MEALLRPRTVAVIGASPNRETLGNVALTNLANYKFAGRVIPVHGSAPEIMGLPTVASIEALPEGIDSVLASVPAGSVADVVRRLDKRGIPGAIVNTAGFSSEQDLELRAVMNQTSKVLVHGPNCMGFINLTDGVMLYTGAITSRVRPGPVALIAQSGSAAISLINSCAAGFSKIVTIGSEFRVTAADYIYWFAGDPSTSVVAIVLESVQDARRFEDAAARARAAGKSIVMLKVGRSEVGARATLAHTGALIRNHDAFVAFARRCGIPLVADYEEMVGTIETFAAVQSRPRGARVSLIGISGGETALACDLATELGVPLAELAETTCAEVRGLLPGLPGNNPVDIGGAVGRDPTSVPVAMKAILSDPATDIGMVVQDMQTSLPDRSQRNYTANLQNVVALAAHAREIGKPLMVVSPTGEVLSPRLLEVVADIGLPVVRGLRAGLVAARSLASWSAWDRAASPPRSLTPERAALKTEIAGQTGTLPAALANKLLASYGIPLVKSAVARSRDEAMRLAPSVGYPMVVKVVSRDVPHRSDVGAVQLGIADTAGLQAALASIERNVKTALPAARIEGFELQEQLSECVQALAGFQAAPPYGALMIVGTGGVMVELEADKALDLAPVTAAEAVAMIGSTRLGASLGGYRNLAPKTDLAPLADAVARLSELAADFCDVIAECDLNPVMTRRGSGEVRVVDALFVAGRS